MGSSIDKIPLLLAGDGSVQRHMAVPDNDVDRGNRRTRKTSSDKSEEENNSDKNGSPERGSKIGYAGIHHGDDLALPRQPGVHIWNCSENRRPLIGAGPQFAPITDLERRRCRGSN